MMATPIHLGLIWFCLDFGRVTPIRRERRSFLRRGVRDHEQREARRWPLPYFPVGPLERGAERRSLYLSSRESNSRVMPPPNDLNEPGKCASRVENSLFHQNTSLTTLSSAAVAARQLTS
jgi:hypothetical protein